MVVLTDVAKRFGTNTLRIRAICTELDIRIFHSGYRHFVRSEDVNRIKERAIKVKEEENLNIDELKKRVETAKRLKETVCGDDVEMSYARFSDFSDICIYRNGDTWVCQGCRLKKRYDSEFSTLTLLKEHVNEHVEAGHNVPYVCSERIDLEITNGSDIWGTVIQKELI